MLSLNIISDQSVAPATQPSACTNRDILQQPGLDTYEKLVAFIHNPEFIRIGPIESVRTIELAATFNNTMKEVLAYKNAFPRLMKRLMVDYPNLLITKRVKNYGTIYKGIGLTTDPIPQQGTAVLLQKGVNEKYLIRDRTFLNKVEKDICEKCCWTSDQYRQMGTLGIIKLIHGKSGARASERTLNIDATIYVIIGELIKYIHEINLKLEEKARYGLSIKIAFEKAIRWDATLSEGNGTPVYTNRLLIAEETYNVGEKLQRAVNSYRNRIQSLPKVNVIEYVNIEELNDLISWLKTNSIHKTRVDMKIQQEAVDPETCQAVNWTLEDEIKQYDNDTLLIVND